MEKLDKYTEKAIKDPDFRKRALEDANKAIKEEFGEEPAYKVTYHVTDSKHIVFTLPPEVDELDDDDLSSVSGGRSIELGKLGDGFAAAGYMCFPSSRFGLSEIKVIKK